MRLGLLSGKSACLTVERCVNSEELVTIRLQISYSLGTWLTMDRASVKSSSASLDPQTSRLLRSNLPPPRQRKMGVSNMEAGEVEQFRDKHTHTVYVCIRSAPAFAGAGLLGTWCAGRSP